MKIPALGLSILALAASTALANGEGGTRLLRQPTLLDGGTMIAPRGGFFTRDGKWAVENEGVGADIEVENTPKEVIAGKDPQLERAVAEALRLLKEKPIDRMMKEPPPPTWGRRKE